MQIRQEKGCYTLYKENEAIGTAVVDGTTILRLEVVPRWRGRGYGSYLLKEILRQNGGLDPKQATRFTAPLPRDAAGRALAQKYGFAPDGSQLVRRRVPDLSAVQLCHAFLTARLAPGGLYVDATCGNGHDTQFLCTLAGPAGRVLGLDIQQQAVDNTNARLAAAGYGAVGRAVLHDHARLAELVQPGTADCVLFNFGWLPGRSMMCIPRRTAVCPPCVRRWRLCAPAAYWPRCSTAERSSVTPRSRPRWRFLRPCR